MLTNNYGIVELPVPVFGLCGCALERAARTYSVSAREFVSRYSETTGRWEIIDVHKNSLACSLEELPANRRDPYRLKVLIHDPEYSAVGDEVRQSLASDPALARCEVKVL